MTSGLSSTSALRWATLILCAAAVYLCWPLVPALVLAVWTAAIARPMVARLDRLLVGRRRAAGVLVFLVFLSVAAPIALMSAAVVVGVRDLLDVVATSASARGALQWIVAGDDTALPHPALHAGTLELLPADLHPRAVLGFRRIAQTAGSAGEVATVLLNFAAEPVEVELPAREGQVHSNLRAEIVTASGRYRLAPYEGIVHIAD